MIKDSTLKKITREVRLINSSNSRKFPRNRIKTSKYNIVNFIPKCLFIQFTRLVNFYFLISAIIMSIETVSPLDPMTAIFPLMFVLFISLVREGIDELVHYNSYSMIEEEGQ